MVFLKHKKALCINENDDFGKMILKPWLQPIKVEADFVIRAKLRKTEEKENTPSSDSVDGPAAKKPKLASYKSTPKVVFRIV